MVRSIRTFMDNAGRIIKWPGRRRRAEQRMIVQYLAEKFEPGVDYTEKQVNQILRQYHTFDDWALLRRELFEKGFLDRTKDGEKYWRVSHDDSSFCEYEVAGQR